MFRYTEKELRKFLIDQEDLWRVEYLDEVDNQSPIEASYARGAQEAYQFVLRFMDEYKLETVPEQYFENVLIKMYGEDKLQPVVVSIGGDLTNTEALDYDGMVFFYFQDEAEFRSSFSPDWEGSDGSFYTVLVCDDDTRAEDYKPYTVEATLVSNLNGTVWARSLEEAEDIVDKHWITDDFSVSGKEFTLEGVYEA